MLQKAVAQCLQNTATSDNPHGGQKVCAKESSATGLILIRVLHKKGYTHKNCTGLLWAMGIHTRYSMNSNPKADTEHL